MTAGAPTLTDILVSYARRVRDGQELARRLGYLAASVEENIEDVTDFHAAVETLIGSAPVSESARRLNAVLTDHHRRLLQETRRARNDLVYDFFIDYPVERSDGTVDEAALARAGAHLAAIDETLREARELVDRLEVTVMSPT
ncbi:hypothetical protein [Roseospira goensis]|uniref:Uncharacterized protein n=1 Tax=Roseospira goensis TaxID=391922 RepID=A0A7W6S1R1_9PROT|nr:hypothetical protein [Roseospira goensis]MBB4286795.1 hypothetical protein [Roseospira goensis]